jgi:hypothetical protein
VTLGYRIRRFGSAVLTRPDLWVTAVLVSIRLIPDRWWRRGVLPPREYLEYRGNAVYGMPLLDIPADEFIRYMEWCKAFPGPIR